MIRHWGLILCVLWQVEIHAQTQPLLPLRFEVVGLENTKLKKKLRHHLSSLPPPDSLQNFLKPWYKTIAKEGWIETSLEEATTEESKTVLHFHQGRRYFLGSLYLGKLPDSYVQKSKLSSFLSQRGKPLDKEKLEDLLFECISMYRNEGYPFASFEQKTTSYQPIGQDSVLTHLAYEFSSGPQYRIDSLVFSGNIREPQRFIHGIVKLEEGGLYKQQAINEMVTVLDNSIYYEQVSSPSIQFLPENRARIETELKPAKAGKFDLLLGLLPGSGENGKFQFVGSADVRLVSSFRQGEIIEFSYNKLISTSQQLHSSITIPYLLGSPFRFHGSFDIFNLEEDYLVRAFEGGGAFALSPYFFVKLSYRNRASRLLDSLKREQFVDTPQQIDGEHRWVNGGFQYEKLDYNRNPGQGWAWNLSFGIGKRKVRKNSLIEEEVYRNIPEDQNALELDFRLKWFHTLFKRQVLHFANHTYWLKQDYYFQNDQLQVGGARSIRGFNENEFFTDFYSFLTLEYRLRLEKDSYIFAFGDYAWMRDKVGHSLRHPTAFGLGMNYDTKAGIISISYAVGKVEGTSFQPSRGKIHIGFVNEF